MLTLPPGVSQLLRIPLQDSLVTAAADGTPMTRHRTSLTLHSDKEGDCKRKPGPRPRSEGLSLLAASEGSAPAEAWGQGRGTAGKDICTAAS